MRAHQKGLWGANPSQQAWRTAIQLSAACEEEQGLRRVLDKHARAQGVLCFSVTSEAACISLVDEVPSQRGPVSG